MKGGWIQDVNKVSSKVTPCAGKSGGGIMQQREHLQAPPRSLQRPNEGVGWWEEHSHATGQVLVFMQKYREVLTDVQLGRHSEGEHFLPAAGHLHRVRQTYGNNFTANMMIFNHVMRFHLRISTSNACFVRKLTPKELQRGSEDNLRTGPVVHWFQHLCEYPWSSGLTWGHRQILAVSRLLLPMSSL